MIPSRRTALTVALCLALVVAATVAGWELYSSTHRAGSVTLDGVLVSIDYAPRSPVPFGPAQNLSCAHCPETLAGGDQLLVPVLWMNITYPAVVYYNLTIWSAVPFHEGDCSGYGPCPLTNHWMMPNQIWTVEGPPGGLSGQGFAVQLEVPIPAPSLPGGFWILAILEVEVVPS